ncbi:MAG: ABC-F family ATP-binding cassette domain-containing protein [Clostridia bacterium]|nr:ABC-F family ATP-binding cassette domain-containing protein [Clostridia bacterium]
MATVAQTAVSVQALEKSFGERPLFAGVTFAVSGQDRVGLIGENGSGKTTLFRLLIGEETADSGQIVCAKNTRIGYMEQHAFPDPKLSLWDAVESVFAPVKAVEERLNEVNRRLSAGETDAELLHRQQQLREQLEEMGGLYYQSRVKATLLGLGFSEESLSRPISSLSGGQRSKAAMARLLLSDANLLLLDEPTNHLDIQSVEWLEEFLRGYGGAAIIISHDRYFLDRVTTRTVELSNGQGYVSDGGYSVHKEKRKAAAAAIEKQYETTMKEIARIEENIALLKQWNREKSIRTAESKEKAVQRLKEGLQAPEKVQDTLKFSFTAKEVSGSEVLTADRLCMAFGENRLFDRVSFLLRRGERTFLLGPNGCGKSTLFNILTGRITPLAGTVRLGAKVSVGYYDQVQANLNPNKTAIEELSDAYPKMSETELRNAMAAFLFRGDEVFQRIESLSGGEKARLLLLKLMLAGHNLLLLDEPTNHLDIPSREALEEALLGYTGTLFMVSHDRYFINRLAHRTLHLTNDGCESVLGGYDEYIRRLPAEKPAEAEKKTAPRPNTYQQQKEWASACRRMQTQITRTEEAIAALETRAEEIRAELESEAVVTDHQRLSQLSGELDAVMQETDEKMQLWTDLQQEWEDLSQKKP